MGALTHPVSCLTWDLADPPPAPNADGRVHVLALTAGWPAAVVDVRGAADPAAVAVRVTTAPLEQAPPSWRPADTSRTGVSVVLCTLGRAASLPETVTALLEQDHADLELLVVDNAPASGRVGRLLADVCDPRLRIVPQPVPGLSWARNAGLAAATRPLVAFTDDDALPARDWVRRLACVLDAAPTVTCVTGLVLPARLLTSAQLHFEEAGGFGKGTRALHWGPAPQVGTVPGPRKATFPFDGGFGSGNNMAFRAARLRELGGFDVSLGAGTPALGGEDLDIFQRVYLAGDSLVYWPAAVVRHDHRPDHAGLRVQRRGYGVGMAAVVTKRFCSSPAAVLRRVPPGLRLLLDRDSEKNSGKTDDYPASLTRAELLGYLTGPVRYGWSRVRSRRLGRGRAST